MSRFFAFWLFVPAFVFCFARPSAADSAPAVHQASTVEEARERARLLHASFSDTLRVVHRDFFRRNEHLPFPSQSLSEVFGGLATNRNVRLRWISGEDTAMNLDHLPRDNFEKEALAALASGSVEHMAEEPGRLRYAGVIVLENKCLKCHLQHRTSVEPRAAGLAITIPFGPVAAP